MRVNYFITIIVVIFFLLHSSNGSFFILLKKYIVYPSYPDENDNNDKEGLISCYFRNEPIGEETRPERVAEIEPNNNSDESEESDSSEEEMDETDVEQPSTSGATSSGDSGIPISNSSFKTAPIGTDIRIILCLTYF